MSHGGNHRRSPYILKSPFPAEEQDYIPVVNDNLYLLGSILNNFVSAVRLYQFANSVSNTSKQYRHSLRPPIHPDTEISDWRFIAARDGAMTLYHFSEVMQMLRNVRSRSRTLYDNLDLEIYKSANRKMQSLIPNLEKLRHGVAHVTKKTSSKEAMTEHGLTDTQGEYGIKITGCSSINVTDCFYGDRFIHNWEGKMLSYDVNFTTVKNVQDIKDLMWSSFEKAAYWSNSF
ncbi:hypothetical protein [Acidiphilium acidophilum]|uniref:hypothetical protein n=1 Tax=Acidiphilium acidophilum TaxID=76588 RepID=UPI002E8E6771|nr:hypothetical protein [Acidiphilium acidophilum]